ncbi:MAG: hypothetical protein CME68_10200 [Halobacteriovoraceae bacterium]|nr:hypothetical protein [Halobacteriovoraceae bacterium]
MRKMYCIKILLVFLMFTNVGQSETCKYSLDGKSLDLVWTAYKTKKKVGVNGTFNEVKLHSSEGANTLGEALVGTRIDFVGTTVNSKNKDRDRKLARFFFGLISNSSKGSGKVLSYNDKSLRVNLSLNGVKKDLDFALTEKDKVLTGKTQIKLFDFNLKIPWQSISRVCNKQHEGLTWKIVDVSVSLKYEKKCN